MMLFPGLLGSSLLSPKLGASTTSPPDPLREVHSLLSSSRDGAGPSISTPDRRPSTSSGPSSGSAKGKGKEVVRQSPPPLQTQPLSYTRQERGGNSISQQLSRSQSQSQSHSHQQSSPNPTAVADRARDMLFGLGAISDHPTPSLPSLQQLSPHALVPPDSVLSQHHHRQQRHPYAFNDQPSPTSPPPGDNGLWESLFDQSQQSYKFHPQPSSVSPDTPSPLGSLHDAIGQFPAPPPSAVPRSADMGRSTSHGSSHSSGTRPRHRSQQSQAQSSRRSEHSQHGGRPSPSHHNQHARTMSHPTPGSQQYVHFEQLDEPEEIFYEDLRLAQQQYAPPYAPQPPSLHHQVAPGDTVLDPLALETLYVVICVHPFHPPTSAWHRGLPFLHLETNDVVDVLLEDGHPSTHQDLPIYIDDGDDCMLVGRDERGGVGWCLASFVMPFV